MKILMLTPYLPYPDSSGGQIRTLNLLKHLHKNHQITLVSLIKNSSENKYKKHLLKYCHKILTFQRSKTAFTLKNILRTGFSTQPFLVIRNLVPEVPFKLVFKEANQIVKLGMDNLSREVLHGTGITDALFPGRILEAGDLFTEWFKTEVPDFTIVMMKPDGFEKQIQMEIIKGLGELGLSLVARKIMRLQDTDVNLIYPNIRNEWLIPKIHEHLTSGPCEAMIFLGNNSVQIARQFSGATALGERPASGIRGKYSDDFIKNIAHSPDSQEELSRTAKVLFPSLPVAN